jgi:hypothetical protein
MIKKDMYKLIEHTIAHLSKMNLNSRKYNQKYPVMSADYSNSCCQEMNIDLIKTFRAA